MISLDDETIEERHEAAPNTRQDTDNKAPGIAGPTVRTVEGNLTSSADCVCCSVQSRMAHPVEQQPKPWCDALACIFAKRLGEGLRSRRGARRDDHVARPCIVQCRVNIRNTQFLGADHRWRCTLQARHTGTRRRCGAEVNHVAASLSTKASGTLASNVAVT